MNCRTARRRILEAQDKLLELEAELELERHLVDCAACARLSRSAQALEESLAALPEPPVERLDLDDEVRAVFARIDARPAAPRAVRTPLRRVALAAGIAFALASAAALAWWAQRAPDAEPIADTGTVEPAPASEPGQPPDVRTAPPVDEGVASAVPAVRTEQPVAEPPLVEPPVDERVASAESVERSDPPPAATPDPAELERLAATRDALRTALATEVAQLGAQAVRADALAFAERVDAIAGPLARSGWPVTRIVQPMLEDGDPEVARAAARYLGVRCDRPAQAALERQLDSAPRRAEAALALCDVGELAAPALERVLGDAELQPLLIARIAGDERFDRAQVFAGALRRLPVPRRGDAPQGPAVDELVAALVRTGAPAAAGLLELAQQGVLSHERALAALEHVDGASRTLAELVESPRAQIDRELLLAALARVQADEAVPWLKERFKDRRHRAGAIACLAAFRGPEGMAALFDLWSEGRLPATELEAPFADLLAREPQSVLALSARVLEHYDTAAARELVDLLVESGARGAAPSLARIAGWNTLPGDDRMLAATAVGELGGPDDAAALEALVRRTPRRERRLAAACLVAVHRLAGTAGVERALAGAPSRELARVVAELGRARGDATSLIQLARMVEPLLDEHPRADALDS